MAADALTEVWKHWNRVTAADDPVACGHGIRMNPARNWLQRRSRERLLTLEPLRRALDPDVPAVLDVRGTYGGSRTGGGPAWSCAAPT